MNFIRVKCLCRQSEIVASTLVNQWKKIFNGEIRNALRIMKCVFFSVLGMLLYPTLTFISLLQDLFAWLFTSDEHRRRIYNAHVKLMQEMEEQYGGR